MACFLVQTGLFEDWTKSDVENLSGWMGLRYDEARRAAKISDKRRIPLFTAGVTIKDISEFWDKQSFTLELPTYNGRTLAGNCDLCFLKPANQVASLIAEKPERAIWWANMEELSLATRASGNVFRQDRPGYASMVKFAADQKTIFDPDEEGISCFCGD